MSVVLKKMKIELKFEKFEVHRRTDKEAFIIIQTKKGTLAI